MKIDEKSGELEGLISARSLYNGTETKKKMERSRTKFLFMYRYSG